MKNLNKRGLSTIVSTLLILLLVFVAIGMLWIVIKNVLSSGTEQIALGKLTLNLKIQDVTISGSNLNVKVKRNPGDGTFTGLSFVLDDGRNSEVIQVRNVSMGEYALQTFPLDVGSVGLIASSIKTIEVAPIFTLESGKEVTGDVKDIYEITQAIQITQECSQDSNCSDNNVGTVDSCVLGSCVYTPIISCVNSDGYCPSTCYAAVDSDCTNECVNAAQCDDGDSNTSDSCSAGNCIHTLLTCSGSTTQSCLIINGVGEQIRTCTAGVWSSWSSCAVVSCNAGYEISGNECAVSVPANLKNELISWWNFDSDAGAVIGSVDGIVEGATHITSGCVYEGCYNFDGVDNRILLNDSVNLVDVFSMSFWVNTNRTSAQTLYSGYYNGKRLLFVVNPGQRLQILIYTTGNYAFTSGVVTLPGAWHNIVASYNGTNMNYYFDSTSVVTAVIGSTTDVPEIYNTVGMNGVAVPFEGLMDEVMIWNRSLSATEVSDLYNFFKA